MSNIATRSITAMRVFLAIKQINNQGTIVCVQLLERVMEWENCALALASSCSSSDGFRICAMLRRAARRDDLARYTAKNNANSGSRIKRTMVHIRPETPHERRGKEENKKMKERKTNLFANEYFGPARRGALFDQSSHTKVPDDFRFSQRCSEDIPI